MKINVLPDVVSVHQYEFTGYEHAARDGPVPDLFEEAIYYPFRWIVREAIGLAVCNVAAVARMDLVE